MTDAWLINTMCRRNLRSSFKLAYHAIAWYICMPAHVLQHGQARSKAAVILGMSRIDTAMLCQVRSISMQLGSTSLWR